METEVFLLHLRSNESLVMFVISPTNLQKVYSSFSVRIVYNKWSHRVTVSTDCMSKHCNFAIDSVGQTEGAVSCLVCYIH